jgi:hypothetical protein
MSPIIVVGVGRVVDSLMGFYLGQELKCGRQKRADILHLDPDRGSNKAVQLLILINQNEIERSG